MRIRIGLVAGVLLAGLSLACSLSGRTVEAKTEKGAAAKTPNRVAIKTANTPLHPAWRIGAPTSFNNLTIFSVVTDEPTSSTEFITLDEGLRYSQRNVKRLSDAGIPVVAATDSPSPWDGSSTHFHGPGMLRELELLVEAGIAPMAALIAATRTPAEMLGLANEIGTIEPGKRADLLIVDGDPLEDIRALRRIRWVIRDGELRTPAGWMQ